MRGVGRPVDGLAGPRNRVLAAEGELHLAINHGEHFLEVVAVGRGTAAGRDVHIDEGVPASGVLTSQHDRVSITTQPHVRKRPVLVGPGDDQATSRVISRDRRVL